MKYFLYTVHRFIIDFLAILIKSKAMRVSLIFVTNKPIIKRIKKVFTKPF